MVNLVPCKKQFSCSLTNGCKQCITGHKSVIFITGVCHYKCFYCPISDDKRDVDIVKVNETVIENPDSDEAFDQIFTEMELCQSKGCSFTGGDPLARIERTVKYTEALKEKFGKDFHIHLYTSLEFLTEEKVKALARAGLNELRFHPDISDNSNWNKMLLEDNYGMLIGIEIPGIPDKDKEIISLIDFAKSNELKFMNINELEISDTNDTRMKDHGFKTKDNISYGIGGSEKTALKAVDYGKEVNFPVHYCSCQFKDAVQLANRFRLRSESVAKEYDVTDEEGLLIRGEISFINKEQINSGILNSFFKKVMETFEIPGELMEIEKNRILIAPWVLEDIWTEAKYFEHSKLFAAFIVKEYPTSDHLIIEKNPLN